MGKDKIEMTAAEWASFEKAVRFADWKSERAMLMFWSRNEELAKAIKVDAERALQIWNKYAPEDQQATISEGRVERKQAMSESYVRAADLRPYTSGSLEEQQERVQAAIEAEVGPVELIATQADRALVRTREGALREATFKIADGAVTDVQVRDARVPQHGPELVPSLVAEELRALVGAMLRGEAVERTQVRACARMLAADEDYWIGDVLRKMEEAESPALTEQEAKIRESMWGQVRELEARIPKTAYAKIPAARLPEFESELRESWKLVGEALCEIIDGASPLVFSEEEMGAIQESLIVEVQALQGLHRKAGWLMRTEDLGRAAVAHDRLCGRARTMVVMAAYLKGRQQKEARRGT